MTTSNTFLAVFIGSKTSPKMLAWNALAEPERQKKTQDGVAAWKMWRRSIVRPSSSWVDPWDEPRRFHSRESQTSAMQWEHSPL